MMTLSRSPLDTACHKKPTPALVRSGFVVDVLRLLVRYVRHGDEDDNRH